MCWTFAGYSLGADSRDSGLFGGTWVCLIISLQGGGWHTTGGGDSPVLVAAQVFTPGTRQLPHSRGYCLVEQRRPGYTHEAKRCKDVTPHLLQNNPGPGLGLGFPPTSQPAGCTALLPTHCPTSGNQLCSGLRDWGAPGLAPNREILLGSWQVVGSAAHRPVFVSQREAPAASYQNTECLVPLTWEVPLPAGPSERCPSLGRTLLLSAHEILVPGSVCEKLGLRDERREKPWLAPGLSASLFCQFRQKVSL